MILNLEQDNSIEGTYLTVSNLSKKDSTLTITFPKNFFINSKNISNWTIGWGNEKAYYDAGVENIRLINRIDDKAGEINLGKCTRGSGLPKKGQRIVFWNKNPSGFKTRQVSPIINTKLWPEFAGSSIAFGALEYDQCLDKWIMIVNEVDTSSIQIYAAESTDLINWTASNNGNPILTAKDFETIRWAGTDQSGKFKQTAVISDVIYHHGVWYLFMDGYDRSGKRHIGIARSYHSILGPFEIIKEPIISPKNGNWNSESCFYAKIEKYKDGYVMFYDGSDEDNLERIGMATSTNLFCWTNSIYNPVIDHHTGWRSFPGSTEPNYIEIRDDTILLMCAGVKGFKNDFWSNYISGRANMGRSGNVSDAQLGLFITTDNGRSFSQSALNPIFTNDYSNCYENEHIGGNFKLISTDSIEFIFYQAKSSYPKMHYNIMLRERIAN